MSSKTTLLATIGLTLAFASGCSSDDDSTLYGPSSGPTGSSSSEIRVLHLSADAPAVDIYVNGADKAVSDLVFAQGTDFLEVPSGTYDFNVAPAGSSASSSVLDIEGLTLEPGMSYTAVAFNEVSSLEALAIEEDLSPTPEGTIRVRAIHAAAGVGEVDIWNVPEGGSPSPLYTDVPFGAVGEYLELPADGYSLGFDVDNDAMPDVMFDLPSLPAGTIANVFAVNDGAVHLLAQFADGTTARIDARM
ncbi:MAG: DUF4397 domain-containing protein [Deltaproteobacteria bacterium]|jgi:hypothetical protein|nr:DUF4397 domain-containing protein [Deltaproteobacteria bacterium]MBW2535465.1 DUF4397 domain-containing protein [Deltaproteobacteria bacterium]